MKKINDTTLQVGPARLSYMNLFKPRPNKLRKDADGRPELQYGVTLLVPKEPTKQCPDPKAELKGIADAIKAAGVAAFGDQVKKYKMPFGDGDTETNDKDEPKHPGYWFLKTSAGAEYAPALFHMSGGKRVDCTGGWDSGDWGIAAVFFKGYDNDGVKGVGCYVNGMFFTHHDEHFGAGSVGADDFDIPENVEEPETATVPPAEPEKGSDQSKPLTGGRAAAQGEYDPFADE